MKSHDSIWVVRIWCGESTNPILRCFINPKGLNCEDLLVGMVLEFTSCLMV
jgi:hypothetical protein